MNIIQGLYYTKDHDWVKVEGEKAYIGITQYAENKLGKIVYVELPEIDDEFAASEDYAVIESVKAATDCHMPITGKVVEVNEEVVDEPELLNADPFKNWMIAIEISDQSDLESLMDSKQYEDLCNELCSKCKG